MGGVPSVTTIRGIDLKSVGTCAFQNMMKGYVQKVARSQTILLADALAVVGDACQ